MLNPAAFPARHLSMAGIYEYGSRVGVWRLPCEFENTLDCNDMRFALPQGYSHGDEFWNAAHPFNPHTAFAWE